MKKRMITLLLALVLVISLLPVGALAAEPSNPAERTITLTGMRWSWSPGGTGFALMGEYRSSVQITYICPKCEKNGTDHDGAHAIRISDLAAKQSIFQKKACDATYDSYNYPVVIGVTNQNTNDNNYKSPDVHSFDESDTVIDVPDQLYYVCTNVYLSLGVSCITDSTHKAQSSWVTTNSFTAEATGRNAENQYTCRLTFDKSPYIAQYNNKYPECKHFDAKPTADNKITVELHSSNVANSTTNSWTPTKYSIDVKCEPDAPDEDFWSFNGAVEVSCTTTADHEKQTYGLLPDTYEIGDVTKNAAGDYTVTGTITAPAAYVGEFSKDHNKLHVEDTGSTYTFAAKWDKDFERWVLTDRAQIAARCEPDAPTVDTIDGLAAVKVDCIADETHKDETYALVKDTYILGEPAFEDGKYVLTGKVNVPDSYVKAYADAHGDHELDKDNSPATFKLVWNAELGRWELKELALIAVRCESAYNPTAPILAALNKTAPKLNTRDHFAYVQGYPDGTVRPSGSVTRAETAAILFRLMDASSRSLYYSTAAGFRDVDSTKWYNTYVATLNNAGVITDSRDGYFRPDAAITRAELAAMLAQFTEQKSAAIYFSDVSAGHWAANAIARTADLGWINGYPDGTFGPDKTVTRAELMAMINRATGRAPKAADALLTGMKTWKDNANTGAWYYLDVQEATNSHSYMIDPTEYWTGLEADPNWAQYE